MTNCPHCRRPLPDSVFEARERDREAELRSMTKRKGPSLGVEMVVGGEGQSPRLRFTRPPPEEETPSSE